MQSTSVYIHHSVEFTLWFLRTTLQMLLWHNSPSHHGWNYCINCMWMCDTLRHSTLTFVLFLPQQNNVMQKWHAKMRRSVFLWHDNIFIFWSDVEGSEVVSTCLKCPQFQVPFPCGMLRLHQHQWWSCCQAVSFQKRRTSIYIYIHIFSTSSHPVFKSVVIFSTWSWTWWQPT